jgi:NADPH:quinone reductase-like Zn-dependent oxidoreductase
MKAVVMHEHGGPEVLKYEEIQDPIAAPGEALVRVRACALNHLDIWTRKGEAGRNIALPHVLGNDVAGEVISLRTPVEGITQGERVMLSPGTSCGRCQPCLSGEDSSCRHYRILG